jgi:hypothetical protein
MDITWLKIGLEKNVLRGLTNFTSLTGITNSLIILSPEMRSGASMLTFKGDINGCNLVIS